MRFFLIIATLVPYFTLNASCFAENSTRATSEPDVWLESTILGVQIKAVDPRQEPGSNPSTPARFSGTLSPAAQNFIGFEVQIPFGTESLSGTRSEDN